MTEASATLDLLLSVLTETVALLLSVLTETVATAVLTDAHPSLVLADATTAFFALTLVSQVLTKATAAAVLCKGSWVYISLLTCTCKNHTCLTHVKRALCSQKSLPTHKRAIFAHKRPLCVLTKDPYSLQNICIAHLRALFDRMWQKMWQKSHV